MSSHAFALANSALLDAAVAPSTLRTYNKNLEQFLTHPSANPPHAFQ
jgi:hypothetical protein